MRLIGVCCLYLGEFEEGKKYLEKSIQINSKSLAHVDLGACLCRMGNLNEAAKRLMTAIRIHPRNSVAHSDLADVMLDLGRSLQAREYFEKAIELDRENMIAHYNLALLLEKQNRLEQARFHLEAVLKIKPQHANDEETLQCVRADLIGFLKEHPDLEWGFKFDVIIVCVIAILIKFDLL